MKSVQVLRHSFTKKGDSRDRGTHLSQEGVELARKVGDTLGSFDLVVASRAPRTAETAVALGYAVEDELSYPDVMDGTGIDFHAWWDWPEPFAEVARIMSSNENASRAGDSIADIWSGIAHSVHDGGTALVVSHGGIMEVGVVAALPDADRTKWGMPFAHCEGFILTMDGERFVDVSFTRL
jgi:broad specificity phosphatase PhoE